MPILKFELNVFTGYRKPRLKKQEKRGLVVLRLLLTLRKGTGTFNLQSIELPFLQLTLPYVVILVKKYTEGFWLNGIVLPLIFQSTVPYRFLKFMTLDFLHVEQ